MRGRGEIERDGDDRELGGGERESERERVRVYK